MMSVFLASFLLLLGSLSIANASIGNSVAQASNPGQVHTPPRGSAERQAILDALREDYQKSLGERVTFTVYYLRVHNGWAWIDVTPRNGKGEAVAEGGPALLHWESNRWAVKDLSVVADDPDDPLGAEDASPVFIRHLRDKYPGAPKDIFPTPKK
jgi:hypothetical protein